MFTATALNYATQYQKALAQAYPYALYFGDLYNTENDSRYQWVDAKTQANNRGKVTLRFEKKEG